MIALLVVLSLLSSTGMMWSGMDQWESGGQVSHQLVRRSDVCGKHPDFEATLACERNRWSYQLNDPKLTDKVECCSLLELKCLATKLVLN